MSEKNPDLFERLPQLLHDSMGRYHVSLATLVAAYLANATIVGRLRVYPFAFVVVLARHLEENIHDVGFVSSPCSGSLLHSSISVC